MQGCSACSAAAGTLCSLHLASCCPRPVLLLLVPPSSTTQQIVVAAVISSTNTTATAIALETAQALGTLNSTLAVMGLSLGSLNLTVQQVRGGGGVLAAGRAAWWHVLLPTLQGFD